MLNLARVAVRSGRFPRRGENAIDNFAETGIARIARVKLHQTRGAFLIEQETADVIGDRFRRGKRVERRLRADAEVFTRPRITRRPRRWTRTTGCSGVLRGSAWTPKLFAIRYCSSPAISM